MPVRIRSEDLHSLARTFLSAQTECGQIHQRLVRSINEHTRVLGHDSSGQAFSDSYRRTAEFALDGFVRAHRLFGAIAAGLGEAAANHQRADARSAPAGHPSNAPMPPISPHAPPPKGEPVAIAFAAAVESTGTAAVAAGDVFAAEMANTPIPTPRPARPAKRRLKPTVRPSRDERPGT